MKRTLKRRKDEKLGDWCDRIAPLCSGLSAKEMYAVLHEVSIESYIAGANVRDEIERKIKHKEL